MEQLQHTLYYLFLSIAAILFTYDSIFLFIRGKNNKPRRMLGITTLSWGVMYAIMVIASMKDLITFPILSAKALISSHFFICLMFLFPLEILLPGWFNKKRIVTMLTPICIISLIYYMGLKLTNQYIEEFMTLDELRASLGKFNVWYRFIILTCNLIFLFFLLGILKRNEKKYIKWQDENFSDQENVDISWLTFYKKMMVVIVICYIFVALWGAEWSIIIHTCIVIIGFSILFYKALFYEHKYSEDFKIQPSESKDEQLVEINTDIGTERPEEIANTSFQAQIPIYVEKLKKWMDEEKPYLFKDFKLQDVSRILPLNRSYLSRLFNEGFNQNFSEVVRTYRIEYAKDLLNKYPTLPMYKISEMCGFTSDSTFNKAFQSITGTTPKQYKSSSEVKTHNR